ncbi:ATP-grasp domain-containing protein [Actinokineospora inagensis]|uniref:ATP-grasp domain-containing protein n=1 Tax=Actinokineospora inagensis TaxID=103730 RepID=UPI0004222C8B|nr:ATP-grasp domain-containing protein [Actinokineospora inagensis]
MTGIHVAFLETNRTGSGYEVMRVAKERGWQVTLVTKDFDFYLQPGQQQIPMDGFDEVVNCDTDDPQAVAAVLSQRADRPDALLSASEFHMLATARTGRLLGLRGQDPDAVLACRDKSLGRRLCASAGVPIPRFVLAATPEEAAAADVGFPCVVKPLDDSGSYGVRLCANPQEVADHAKALLQWVVNEVGQPKLPGVLVEEYMHGREISVEVIVADSQVRVIAMTDKVLLAPPIFYEIGHTVPASLDPEVERACREAAVQALDALGYDFGAAHVELMLTPDGPRLVEVNCRLAGDQITRLVKLATGYDMHAALLDIYLGTDPGAPRQPNHGAAIVFVPSPGGRILGIDGVDAARSMPNVVDVATFVEPGAVLPEEAAGYDRLGYVVAVAEDGPAAASAAQDAVGAIQVDVETVPASDLR